MNSPLMKPGFRITITVALLTFILTSLNTRPAFAKKIDRNDQMTLNLATSVIVTGTMSLGIPNGFSFWKALTQPFVEGGMYTVLKDAGWNKTLSSMGAALFTAGLYTGLSKGNLPLKQADGSFATVKGRPVQMLGKTDDYLGLKVIGHALLIAGTVRGTQLLGEKYMADNHVPKNMAVIVNTYTDLFAVGTAATLSGMYDFTAGLPLEAKTTKDGIKWIAFKPNANIFTAAVQGSGTPGLDFYLSQAIIGGVYHILASTMDEKDFKNTSTIYSSFINSGSSFLAKLALGGFQDAETGKVDLKKFSAYLAGVGLTAAASYGFQEWAKSSGLAPEQFAPLAYGVSVLASATARYITDEIPAKQNLNQREVKYTIKGKSFYEAFENTAKEKAQDIMGDILTFGVGYERAGGGPYVYGTPVYYAQAGRVVEDINKLGFGPAIINYYTSKFYYHAAKNLVEPLFVSATMGVPKNAEKFIDKNTGKIILPLVRENEVKETKIIEDIRQNTDLNEVNPGKPENKEIAAPEWVLPVRGDIRWGGKMGDGRDRDGDGKKEGIHQGQDIYAIKGGKVVEGRPVYPARDGVVIKVVSGQEDKRFDRTNYGNYVVIEHDNGFVTVYAHLASVNVKVGDEVTTNNQIGKVGSTGFRHPGSNGHLHFEIRQITKPADKKGTPSRGEMVNFLKENKTPFRFVNNEWIQFSEVMR